MDILDELNYKHKLYKLRLITKDINLFNFQEKSDNWDKLAKAMEDDLHREEEFIFVHPTSNSTEYKRHYVHCPVNGNTVIFVGKMRVPGDFATVRITLHSLYYKQPYLVIEDYKKSFSNPDIPAEMVRSAFNWALRNEGLEVILEPWDTSGEPVYWMMDNWVSYVYDLRKHPEIGAMCMGFEEALADRKQKEAIEKAKMEKKEKSVKTRSIKSDNIKKYIVKGDKNLFVSLLHELIDGLTLAKDIVEPIRFLCDRKVFKDKKVFRLPYKAFIKEFPFHAKKISKSHYNGLIDPNKHPYDEDENGEKYGKIFKL